MLKIPLRIITDSPPYTKTMEKATNNLQMTWNAWLSCVTVRISRDSKVLPNRARGRYLLRRPFLQKTLTLLPRKPQLLVETRTTSCQLFERGGSVPLVLSLQLLYNQGKSSWHILDGRTGESQSWYRPGTCSEVLPPQVNRRPASKNFSVLRVTPER